MSASIEQHVRARVHDVLGLPVRRALPTRERRSVGPFLFLDHMGPARFEAGTGVDVAPHPHIGLATVTYLYRGVLLHRDSLGVVQEIRPGEVNWMTAGRGIVHSERTPSAARESAHELHGLQCWVGLPREHEEDEPGFAHHGSAELPCWEEDGATLRLVAGAAYGLRAPTPVLSPLFYVDAVLAPGASATLPEEPSERALYLVEGRVELAGRVLEAGELLVLGAGGEARARAVDGPARAMLLGGEPFPEPRFLDWNFASSSRARLERAREEWNAERFPDLPGESGRVPYPRR